MAKLLALEWDGREARLAIAHHAGNRIIVDDAFTVDLAPRNAGDTFADVDIGQRVATALSTRGINRIDTLVAVGRASIELRVLTVPQAPEEELPDIVRFQALRQFSSLGTEWPLDFIVLGQGEEGINILAAAISPELISQIQETCAAGNLNPQRLVLRPFAAASTLRTHGLPNRCRLMLDLLADEADLTVLVDEQVVFMRTVRRQITDDEAAANRTLIGEVRRTMVAAQNQLGGRRVEEIVIFGNHEDHRSLREAIEAQLSLDTQFLNPFDNIEVGRELRSHPPDHPGRFAPLLGMLLEEASSTGHAIDFLNPRQRPAAPTQLRRNSLVAALVAVAVICCGGLIWLQMSQYNHEINLLKDKKERLKKNAPMALKITQAAEEIDEWVEGDVNWLDELRELSEEFPTGDKAVITQFSANALPSGGRLTLTGAVNDFTTVTAIDEAISDKRHDVKGRGARPTEDIEHYERTYTKIVTIQPYFQEAADETPPDQKPATGEVTPTKQEPSL